VYAQLRDRAGNVSEPFSDQITLSLKVRVPQDVSSLQEAIQLVLPGGIVEVAAGTYKANLVITKPMTVRGAGPRRTVIKSARYSHPVVQVKGDAEVTLEGLTITGALGRCNGGICPYGLYVKDSARVTLTEVNISGNYYGGLCVTSTAQVTLKDCTVSDNGNHGGPGLHVLYHAQVTLKDSTVSNNGDSGLIVEDATQAFIEGCLIEGNGIDGITVLEDAHVELSSTTVRYNTGWGIAAYLKKCGKPSNYYYEATVLWRGRGNKIYGNRKGDVCLR